MVRTYKTSVWFGRDGNRIRGSAARVVYSGGLVGLRESIQDAAREWNQKNPKALVDGIEMLFISRVVPPTPQVIREENLQDGQQELNLE